MKYLLKSEQLGLAALSIYFFPFQEFPWWVFPLCFLLPDLGMLGYLISNKAGAITYNITHHQGLGAAVMIAALYSTNDIVLAAGSILVAHSAFDRVLGFGLKYQSGFWNSHLDEVKAR